MNPALLLKKIFQQLLQIAAVTTASMTFIGNVIAAQVDFPPLVQPATSEHHPGKIIWADLITTDMAGSKRFYGGLFGWTFRDIVTGQDHPYAIASLDDQPVAGFYFREAPASEHRQPAWLTFIAVRDVNAAKRAALAHGARVLAEPRNYPQRGQQAVFADPQGAVFAVLASRSGDPPDDEVSPGEWIWSSLLTRDADTDAAFYQSVFGYDVFDANNDDGNDDDVHVDHVVLSSDNYARASINTFSDAHGNRHPHWLNFVRVTNTDEACTRAAELGGRVLVEPHIDRRGERIAIIADPAGAVFGLMEWANDNMESSR